MMLWNWMKRLLPHGIFILSSMFVVFFVLDEFNPMMNFSHNSISDVLLWALVLLSLLQAIILIYENCSKEKVE